ncbi:CBS domain-containing protein [Actinosynnema sp. NPDC047251]|uniref:CBS domain-containing protein n=1 Tax=Saccharothrix espanaensis (strain ATCC 51144 / DSM 44229 / JCM 9112 / NBRC 15066 / NRRL 15764) TaxID=1179773 RepID=K0K7L9_SACES|nr:CBS domain-containing protein [Saccharothrix espanaensis]CCH32889.1 hypothetical protein BN6_56300 [Saccharothrix espanaensis DSM 44229]
MRACDIMTSPVIAVTPDVPAREAAALLVSHGFTATPVVDEDERLIGIVTEADLVRGRYTEGSAGDTPVSSVMTTPVFAMGPGTPVVLIARVMVDDRVRCVPIVDGARLLDVVTRRDLVRALARTDAAIAADVRARLDACAGPGRWTASVHDGEVSIDADFPDEQSARVAVALAEAVPGVAGARVRDTTERIVR